MQEISAHIKVRKTQCQKFSFPDSCPEQDFKYQIILTLWLNPGDKAVIFCFRPKFQLISIRFPHLFYFLTWIFLQIVNFLCMIKQCIQLVLNHAFISLAVIFFLNGILPLDNLCRCDLIHFSCSKIRNNVLVHHVLLVTD